MPVIHPFNKEKIKHVKHVGQTYHARVGHVLGLALCRVFIFFLFFSLVFFTLQKFLSDPLILLF
jgi:hypothetical protein